jgi:hypothetical protein
MNRYLLLIIGFISTSAFYAQNLDSLFNEFVRIRSSTANVKEAERIAASTEPEKCGFRIVNEVKINFDKFNYRQKIILSSLLGRPQADTSFVTPSGKFRIHYKKTGSDAPSYSLIDLAKAADSSYNYQVNILGYPPPPGDMGAGGDDKYDIYIANLAFGYYGYTELENELPGSRYTSFTVIDNDFSTQNTKGIDGARVTIAHELHHAIQMGNYIYRSNDIFYHEISSTAMEEFVFDSINDYYYYIRSFTDRPGDSFFRSNGYNLAVWNIFLKERFGFHVLKRIWELMRDKRALVSIADAIGENNSMFKDEFTLFGQWLYFTGSRAFNGKYFKEAKYYPLIKPLMTSAYNKPQTKMEIASYAVSLNYLVFTDYSTQPDTFVAIIGNGDITSGVNDPSKTIQLRYILSNQSDAGFRKILNGYFTKLESDNIFLVSEMNVFNNAPLEYISSTNIDYPFPQPFRYSKDSFINFPAGNTPAATADLYVYSVDMDLIYKGELKVYTSDKKIIMWNVVGNNNKKLSTGVYLYVVKSEDSSTKGKFVVYND